MKPGTRATMSTLSIAVTRPRKSPVSVTCRLTTGITDTAGGGAPWAAAAPQPTTRLSAPAAMLQPKEPLRAAIEVLLTAGWFRDRSRSGFCLAIRRDAIAAECSRVRHLRLLVRPTSQYPSAVLLQYRARTRALPPMSRSPTGPACRAGPREARRLKVARLQARPPHPDVDQCRPGRSERIGGDGPQQTQRVAEPVRQDARQPCAQRSMQTPQARLRSDDFHRQALLVLADEQQHPWRAFAGRRDHGISHAIV